MAIYTARIGSQYQIVLTINTQSQSQGNNTSTLTYSLRVDKLSGYGYWTNDEQPYSIKINGQTVKSGRWTYNFNNYSTKTLDSGTITLSHNSNGELSVSVEASVRMYSLGTGTISNTFTPDKIKRGIDTFLLNSGWVDVDSNKNVTFSKPNSSIRAQLEWKYYNEKLGSWSNTRTVSTNYTSGSNFSFSSSDITLLHTQNPNSKTVYIEVTLKSYQTNTLTKTVTRGVNLKLKAEPPEINSTFKINGKGQELFNNPNYAVQNAHWIKITDNVSAKNGATISRIEVTFEERKLSTRNAEFRITKSGTSTILVKATDSRGYHHTKNIGTIYVKAYVPPKLSGYKITRFENGIENPLGSTGAVLGTISFKNVTNQNGANINNAWWRVSFQSNTVSSAAINATKNIPVESSENFTLNYGDSFSQNTIKGTIPFGQAPLVIGKQSVGINTIPEPNLDGLHIGGNSNYSRAVYFNHGDKKQLLRTATGYSQGNGIGFIMEFGANIGILFLNDGTIWTVDKGGNRIRKIAG